MIKKGRIEVVKVMQSAGILIENRCRELKKFSSETQNGMKDAPWKDLTELYKFTSNEHCEIWTPRVTKRTKKKKEKNPKRQRLH